LDKLLLPSSVYQPNADFTTISVDVMSVTGAAATGFKNDTDVFYDTEILAIVRRVKLKSSGLVETTLWGWQGRRSQISEREQRKLKDMARHYGTKLLPVQQGCEPLKLVHALGGRLATRQVRLKKCIRSCLLCFDSVITQGHALVLECGEYYYAPSPTGARKPIYR
jgi:hypothetical protein